MVAPPNFAFGIEAVQARVLPPFAFYRCVSLSVLANLGVHCLDGAHAGTGGGRFHPPGSLPICYLAGSQTIAAFECEQGAMALALPTQVQEPRVTFAVHVTGAKVIDLTQGLIQATLGVALEDLIIPSMHWQHLNAIGQQSLAQQLGHAIRTSRPDVDGLIVPSWLAYHLPQGLIPRTENLVLFMDSVKPRAPRGEGVTIAIYDPTNLLP